MAINLGVNYLAVIVGMVVAFAIGALWYSPPLFGKQFAASHRLSVEQMRPGPEGFVIGALAGLLNSWALAVLALNLGAKSLTDGLVLGGIVWLGFFASALAGDTVFSKGSWSVWAINAAHALIVQVVVGAIVSVWR
jgi:hypothetical protein